MTFTQEFIDLAILEHKTWIEKVSYIVENVDFPVAWKINILSTDTELNNLMCHMRNEIFEQSNSKYAELKYELEYTKEKIQKMYIAAGAICFIIEISKKKLLDLITLNSIKIVISIILQEINTISNDIISRLNRWKEI